MTLNYITAESAVKPPEIEIGVTTVYLRRNYTQIERAAMDGESTVTMWQYEEAQLTKDEALQLLTDRQDTLTHAVDDADSMNVDQEYRLTLLELGLSETET